MAVNLSPVGGVAAQFFTNTGAVLTGGKIYTYAAGTTTPATTYTTGAGGIAWTNPIVLDAAGRVPNSGEIWLTDGVSYKFVLKDSTDVLIATYDNISGINSNFINFLAEQEIQTATAGQTVFTLTTTEYQPGTNTLSVFVDGVNQYGPGAQYAYTETSSTSVTFTNGLHVGAVVKFTTTQTLSGGAIDASQVVYDPPFTGSVETNVELKLAQYVSVKDFGATGDGTTDDTAAIQAALNAASSTTFRDVMLLAGNYLISSTITIPEGVSLIGQGNRSAESLGVEGQPAKLTKKSTMTTAGVKMTGKRSRLANLGVYSQVGATGDGIWIAANYCSLVNVASNGHAGAGIRIGATAAAYLNCNAWYLEQVTASYNGSHGVIIDDQFTAYPLNDANAGTYIGGELRHNGDDGLFVGNCFGNTFIGILTEVNTGYGMFFDNESAKCTIIGGDQDEGNTVGVIYNNGQYHTFIGVLSSSFTDVGSYTNLLGFTGTKLNAATVATSVTVSTGSVTTAPSMVVLKNQSDAANGRGAAIEFQVPAGVSTAPRAGGKLTVRNTIDPLYDSADLYLNVNGTLTGFVGWESYPTGRSYKPAVDNDVDLGYTSYRWKQLYAGTATINTSDERQKEQFAEITTAERNVALKIKAVIKSFKFKDAVAQKGDAARIHFGVGAQTVAEIFRSEGLDPNRYSLFCHDQWQEQQEVVEDGQVIVPYRAAGDAYGIRYEELLAFMIATI